MTPGQTQKRDKLKSIDRIAEHFHDWVYYIDDEELKADVVEWLETVDSLHATDLLDHIETSLSQLRRHDDEGVTTEYQMRRPYDSGQTDGHKHFPDSCQGCPHEGVCCPVFHNPEEKKARERMQKELDGAGHVRTKQEYDRFASANNCHQILTFIDEFAEYEQLLGEGWKLYKRVVGVVDAAPDDLDAAAAEQVERADELATDGGR